MHIKHLTLRVRNLEKSIQFYETIAELTVARRLTVPPAELAFMTNGSGETEIELLHIPQGQAFEGKGMFIYFATDELDDKHRQAQTSGLNPSPIQDPGDLTRYFYLYDTDGVSIQLRSFLSEPSN